MQAITVEYKTSVDGSKYLRAVCGAGKLIQNRDYEITDGQQSERMAHELAERFGWLYKNRLVGGHTNTGLKVYVLVKNGVLS